MSRTVSGNGRHRARPVHCAIYTRKSSEEGLAQAFNSLDAQREACEAYITSQKSTGWQLVRARYDDGGLSGGTLERPALQRLLADIAAGRIDAVVVYKVDRLTRSLADFAKIVEVFDAHGVSFVSVTQAFKTTTSMGRLTLNMLLSFAQFEREVTGERIRDKIAASKQKGMWMGGLPPLGYDVQDRKLVVNAAEAETIRTLFRLYLQHGCVRRVKAEADRLGLVTKRRATADGRMHGGRPLSRGHIYKLLGNPLYAGRIAHKGVSYPGQHAAIIDAEVWQAVQAKLGDHAQARRSGAGAAAPSPLAGLLYDADGGRLTPSHAVKNGRRYRYYVSRPLITPGQTMTAGGRRLPAGDIERLVDDRLCGFLASEAAVHGAIEPRVPDGADQQRLIARARDLALAWSDLSAAQRRAWLRALVSRIEVGADRIDLHLDPTRLAALLAHDRLDPLAVPETVLGANDRLTLSIRARLKRAGLGTRMILDGQRADAPDRSLIKLLIKAYQLREKLLSGEGISIAALAQREGISDSSITRHVRLTFLAPDIVRDILDGRHPPTLTAAKLIKDTRLPLAWAEQRVALGFT